MRVSNRQLAAMKLGHPAFRDEADFDWQIRELFKAHGWLAYHTYRSIRSPAGFPDEVFTNVRTGRTVYAELKMPGNTPSPAQIEWLDALSIQNEVYLWYPKDWDYIEQVANYNIPDRARTWGKEGAYVTYLPA